MPAYHFKGILQKEGWIKPAYVQLDEQGKVITINKKKQTDIQYTNINGYALPGMQNAHSHAFQYAMVGLTEQHDANIRDDFWAWRKAMYQLALTVTPEQMEAIATMLYAEMLRHGYTEVSEFHYVHHQASGAPYDNIAELGERLIAAAKNVGIKITLIPIFYQQGGFGKAAHADQKRFLSKNLSAYWKLVAASEKAATYYPLARTAVGVHSMRAVDPVVIKEVVETLEKDTPFHIHVSEQLKEVEASLKYLGKRPVEWLLDNIDLNENFHLVHATHLTEEEAIGLAESKAKVVLCPSTEGNLGDGIFRLKTFQEAGGQWSIGTDSHIGLNPFEELRILDYGQRLISHQRNTFTSKKLGDSGRFALNHLIHNGRKAMGKSSTDFFQKGQAFDVLVMDATVPIFNICALDNLTSTMVYASDISMHLGTMVNGAWVIKKGKHAKDRQIKKQFTAALKSLKNR